MKTVLKIQKDGVNTLKEEILKHSNKQLQKIYVMIGCIKETGYDVLEECLIDLKAKKYIVMGIDKKNTTKKMLDNILSYTKNVYVWDNNEQVELSSNIFVFKYEDEAIILAFSGDVTDELLENDIVTYIVTTYDLVKDKKEYIQVIDTLTKTLKDDVNKLTKEYITELSENKKIFSTKQYIHAVPSIAELLGNKEEGIDKKETQVVTEEKLSKVDLDNFSDVCFEIDLSDLKIQEQEEEKVVEIDISDLEDTAEVEDEYEETIETYEKETEYEISEEAIDLEDVIFETETVRLDKRKIEKNLKEKKKEKEDNKPISKKIDLKKVSNIIMELPKKVTKGRDVDSIKVPTYIKDMVPDFFESMEDAKLMEREDGKYKESNIRLEIIDVNSGEKYTDNNAKLSHRIGQTYITFESEKIIGIEYEELDIARVIKLSKDSYHIEFIPSNMEEYNLWKKMCTNTFRGSSRQYGLM